MPVLYSDAVFRKDEYFRDHSIIDDLMDEQYKKTYLQGLRRTGKSSVLRRMEYLYSRSMTDEEDRRRFAVYLSFKDTKETILDEILERASDWNLVLEQISRNAGVRSAEEVMSTISELLEQICLSFDEVCILLDECEMVFYDQDKMEIFLSFFEMSQDDEKVHIIFADTPVFFKQLIERLRDERKDKRPLIDDVDQNTRKIHLKHLDPENAQRLLTESRYLVSQDEDTGEIKRISEETARNLRRHVSAIPIELMLIGWHYLTYESLYEKDWAEGIREFASWALEAGGTAENNVYQVILREEYMFEDARLLLRAVAYADVNPLNDLGILYTQSCLSYNGASTFNVLNDYFGLLREGKTHPDPEIGAEIVFPSVPLQENIRRQGNPWPEIIEKNASLHLFIMPEAMTALGRAESRHFEAIGTISRRQGWADLDDSLLHPGHELLQFRIHHISDLMFGRFMKGFDYHRPEDITSTVAQHYLNWIAGSDQKKPHFVVLTGNSTSSGHRKEYRALTTFLEQLSNLLLDVEAPYPYSNEERIVIVPGVLDHRLPEDAPDQILDPSVDIFEIPSGQGEAVDSRSVPIMLSDFALNLAQYSTPFFRRSDRTHTSSWAIFFELAHVMFLMIDSTRLLSVPFDENNKAMSTAKEKLLRALALAEKNNKIVRDGPGTIDFDDPAQMNLLITDIERIRDASTGYYPEEELSDICDNFQKADGEYGSRSESKSREIMLRIAVCQHSVNPVFGSNFVYEPEFLSPSGIKRLLADLGFQVNLHGNNPNIAATREITDMDSLLPSGCCLRFHTWSCGSISGKPPETDKPRFGSYSISKKEDEWFEMTPTYFYFEDVATSEPPGVRTYAPKWIGNIRGDIETEVCQR